MNTYKALKPFVLDGLTYEEGQRYELAEDKVATLEAGTVELYVAPAPVVNPPPANVRNPKAKPEKPKEWVGGHIVGRD